MKFSAMTDEAKLQKDKIINRYKDVPEMFDGVAQRKTTDKTFGAFYIDEYVVVTKPDMVRNKETRTWEVKTSKKGKELTITLIYAMCRDADTDERFFFTTKSTEMLTQLPTDEEHTEEHEGRNGIVKSCHITEPIDDKLVLAFVPVKYHDGKTYDQPILAIAE